MRQPHSRCLRRKPAVTRHKLNFSKSTFNKTRQNSSKCIGPRRLRLPCALSRKTALLQKKLKLELLQQKRLSRLIVSNHVRKLFPSPPVKVTIRVNLRPPSLFQKRASALQLFSFHLRTLSTAQSMKNKPKRLTKVEPLSNSIRITGPLS